MLRALSIRASAAHPGCYIVTFEQYGRRGDCLVAKRAGHYLPYLRSLVSHMRWLLDAPFPTQRFKYKNPRP